MIYICKLISPLATGISAGDIEVGKEVVLSENSSPVNYIVVHQGLPSSMYDASCEGTWLLRKDIRENGAWNTNNVNTLAGSTIMSTMAGYLTSYDERVQEAIKTVKIPYCVGGGNTTIMSGGNGLECKIFPLGYYELGFTINDIPELPIDGSKLSYFYSGVGSSALQKRISNINGSPGIWHQRTAKTNDGTVFIIDQGGGAGNAANISSYGLRPALILPYSFKFKESEVA